MYRMILGIICPQCIKPVVTILQAVVGKVMHSKKSVVKCVMTVTQYTRRGVVSMLSAVKRVRMEKGFSQQRMGEMVGIHRTIVSNIEGRRFVPNAKQRQAIADLLGGRESDFFDQQTGLAK